MNLLERIVEGGLWKSRYIVLTGVISSLVAAFAMFYIATIDTFYTVIHLRGIEPQGIQ